MLRMSQHDVNPPKAIIRRRKGTAFVRVDGRPLTCARRGGCVRVALPESEK
jgi:hypothetical protein